VRLDAEEIAAFSNAAESGETLTKTLWQRYYAATNIRQRKNPGLQDRMLPRRFWRYLPEKTSPHEAICPPRGGTLKGSPTLPSVEINSVCSCGRPVPANNWNRINTR